MKSLKGKILLSTISIMLAVSVIISCMSAYFNYTSTVDTLEQTLSQTVEIAGQRVSAELSGYKRLVKELANTVAKSEGVTPAQCEEIAKNNGFTTFSITNANGISLAGDNLSDREYFQNCKNTLEPFVSDPILRKDDGAMNIIIAAPILKDGRFTGVAHAGIDASFLCDIMANIHIGESGSAAVLNKEGTTIAYADVQLVLDAYNTQVEVQKDPDLKRLADMEYKMMQGESGFGDYFYGGINKYMAYAPVPDSNGWSMEVTVSQSEFLKSTFVGLMIATAVSVAILIIAVLFMIRLAQSISSPIKQCMHRIEKLADGDLKTPVPEIHAKDETGTLARSTKKLVATLDTIIGDADYLLVEMSGGNFTVSSKCADSYIGDFENLKLSIGKINSQLSNTLKQINEASDQVASGSDQVSSGAQALSQGATQQASAVEELAATITDVSGQIQQNADNAQDANNKTKIVENEVGKSNHRMQEMLAAMSDISNSSGQIAKIIKTIEDIAFQTNILALNAAVEAARAGAAGKGFAVVADEVRNLASKSAEASKNTSQLIASSLESVENGAKIANETAKSLENVVDGIADVTATVDKIAEASSVQAQSITQITQGIDQIASVVQTNSATAEESAAASEELSGQAAMLKSLTGRFRFS